MLHIQISVASVCHFHDNHVPVKEKKCITEGPIDEIFSVQIGFLSLLNTRWKYFIKQSVHPPPAAPFICQSCWGIVGHCQHFVNILWARKREEEEEEQKKKQIHSIKIKTNPGFRFQQTQAHFTQWFVCWRGRGSRQRGMLGCSSGDADARPPSLREFWRTRSPWAACFHWSPTHTHKQTVIK